MKPKYAILGAHQQKAPSKYADQQMHTPQMLMPMQTPVRLPLVGASSTGVHGTSAESRRHVIRKLLCLVAAAATTPCLPAIALPEECTNGAMEQRQAMGLDPFAPPCQDPDPWARSLPPVYPIFVAKRAVENILADEETFRAAIRLAQPTGALQLPPEINPSLLERIANFCESKGKSAERFREASRCYVRAAYDANELVAFAYSKNAKSDKKDQQPQRFSDAEVCEFVDGALAACRQCNAALGTIVALLPEEVVAAQGVSGYQPAMTWTRRCERRGGKRNKDGTRTRELVSVVRALTA